MRQHRRHTYQVLVRPTTSDPTAWSTYWQTQNQEWRTEPEISLERQEELKRYLKIVPDIVKGIYPFKGIKLDRADVEWLLARHDAGQGPVNWINEQERQRFGLDLRGADLRGTDLHALPLTKLIGGLTSDEHMLLTEEQVKLAEEQIRLTEERLRLLKPLSLTEEQDREATVLAEQLREVTVLAEQLRGAAVLMDRANLKGARLEGANLRGAQLRGANLSKAQLERCDLSEAQLKGASLIETQLKGADLSKAQLEGAILQRAQLEGADLIRAQLKGANLRGAQLEGGWLIGAQLEGANCSTVQLKGAILQRAQLERANLQEAQLEGADLREAQLDRARLGGIMLGNKQHIGPYLVDVQWGNANLAVVDWSQVTKLGDEWEAENYGEKKEQLTHLRKYQAAVRANRQLAVALQVQGLNEDAARFAYRAQRLQRVVLRRQRKVGQYLFSGLLELLAGYGYKPGRSVIAYLVIIVGFMCLYLLNAHFATPHLRWDEALVLSVSSFHGRGFFSQDINLGDTYARLAAAEAVIGLIIEISFIATFTQRFFGK